MKPKSPKSIHERAHAGPRGTDNLGKRLLTNFRYNQLRFPFLTEVGHEQKHPRQTPFAGVEKLIDQVLLDVHSAQDVCHEDFCELRLVVERAHHFCFIDPHDDAIRHR